MLPGNVVIGGDLGVQGEMVDEPGSDNAEPGFKVIEQSRPQTAEQWDKHA
ncbi:hypothetical protein Clow_01105 [Corynebacterium lowii]|uniref:Uncharacterized protein n=1 Tax=Corynebacterium lowii TaxID=1544413 RepID=A0A0Q0UFN4_9CORY|nr:hypothetical protein Clow_01105 [Corynebacterium lowii]MDP9851582.1 hypothetical protein [Corynebacterium lowii]